MFFFMLARGVATTSGALYEKHTVLVVAALSRSLLLYSITASQHHSITASQGSATLPAWDCLTAEVWMSAAFPSTRRKSALASFVTSMGFVPGPDAIRKWLQVPDFNRATKNALTGFK
jgi:hypothetical protein